ncbi:hypothetical protein CJF30_00001180 [Rutstroemia sp. NJR-2017a BBW]|nr:hypothetical protein CJF30_00001180 [Rutstroemia sp. NJR-2017a BBW]
MFRLSGISRRTLVMIISKAFCASTNTLGRYSRVSQPVFSCTVSTSLGP